MAMQLLRPTAEKNNPRAQQSLGNIYKEGYGVPRDYPEAIKWYKLSAEQGNSYAEYNLGYMYFHEQGVPQNSKYAFKWYQLSANHRNAKAQKALGELYEKGEGTTKDYVLAYMWYELYDSYVLISLGQENRPNFKDELKKKMTSEQIKKANELAKNNPLINRRKSGRLKTEES